MLPQDSNAARSFVIYCTNHAGDRVKVKSLKVNRAPNQLSAQLSTQPINQHTHARCRLCIESTRAEPGDFDVHVSLRRSQTVLQMKIERLQRKGSTPSSCSVRPRPERLSALSVFHSKLLLYGAFVWACRALNRPFRRFSAWAVAEDAAVQKEWVAAIKKSIDHDHEVFTQEDKRQQ
jgi:hypothetical protein